VKILCTSGFIYNTAAPDGGEASGGIDWSSSIPICGHALTEEETAPEHVRGDLKSSEMNEILGHIGLKRSSSCATDQETGQGSTGSYRNKRKRSGTWCSNMHHPLLLGCSRITNL